MYLFIEDGILKAGTPNNGNADFERVQYGYGYSDVFGYRQGDCFMAFEWNGEQSTSSCEMTISNYETLMLINIIYK